MATRMREELGPALSLETARDWGYRDAVRGLRDDLGRIGVEFDTWFSEQSLHDGGEVATVLADLDARGVVDRRDGAVWLRTTDFGDSGTGCW